MFLNWDAPTPDQSNQSKSRKIKIASGRASATLAALCQNPKNALAEEKRPSASVWMRACRAKRSAAKAGHNNIKPNPVFRGMVFADRI
jgi:hypothetical protein